MSFRPLTDENQYLDIRKCNSGAGSFTQFEDIGFLEDPNLCTGPIIWFTDQSNKDFEISEYDPDEWTIEREDVEGKNIFKKTTPNQMEWKVTFTIKPNGRLLDYITRLNINESINGKKGESVIKYADGGVFFRITRIFKDGTPEQYTIRQTVRIELAKWFSTLSSVQTSDTTFDFEGTVEEWPSYEVSGNLPDDYGYPADLEPVSISYTSVTRTASSITLKAVKVLDPSLVLPPSNEVAKPIVFALYDDLGEIKQTKELPYSTVATDVVFTGVFDGNKEYTIIDGYKLNNNVSITDNTIVVPKIAGVVGEINPNNDMSGVK